MALTITSFEVPNIADAYAHPLDYELSFSCLGWALSRVGDGAALLITAENAKALLEVMEKALKDE
jgi:hypothetical protein